MDDAAAVGHELLVLRFCNTKPRLTCISPNDNDAFEVTRIADAEGPLQQVFDALGSGLIRIGSYQHEYAVVRSIEQVLEYPASNDARASGEEVTHTALVRTRISSLAVCPLAAISRANTANGC